MVITISDDFDLKKIAESGQCFRWEALSDGGYRVLSGNRCLRIRPLPAGGTGNTAQTCELDCPEDEFHSFWQNYFDLSENYRQIRARVRREEDPFLYTACEREKGIRILRQDLFETLESFIISQNRSIPMIQNSIRLLCRAAGEEKKDSAGISYFTFPSPEAIASLPESVLRDCRLGYRWKYVRAAAIDFPAREDRLRRFCCDQASEDNAADAAALEELTGFFGVGVKVANCVSLFALHRLNAFPVDTWVRKILAGQYPKGYPSENYSPYNGVYQQYMFAWYRQKSASGKLR